MGEGAASRLTVAWPRVSCALPKSCTWSHHRDYCQRLQQALTFCACMKGNASLWICKLLIWLSSIYDAALANIAVSLSDKKRQRRKKKEKLFCTDTFYLNSQSVIFLTDAQSGPKTDKGPFPGCLLANYPIEWLLVLSVFIDLMMATPVNSGASLHLRVPFLAMNTINKLLS